MLRYGVLFAVCVCALTSAAQAQTQPTPPAAPATEAVASAPTAPPPLLVVVLGERNATANWEGPIRDSLRADLAPMVRGREVSVVTDTAAFSACRAPECLGQAVASAHGIGALIVRLHARDPRTLDVQFELIDPISGAARHAPLRSQIGAAARTAPSPVFAPVLAEMAASMPAPPPPPATLLITVTADEAQVLIDGTDAGRSPLAPITIATGRHTVVVSRSGYETLTRLVQVGDTGPTRADFDLVPTEETAAALAASPTGTLAASEHNPNAAAMTTSSDDSPLYTRWYVIAGAAAIVAVAVIVVVAASSGGDTLTPNGIPVPPIVR